MKRSSRLEKWATGFLGLVSLVLIVNLILRSGVRAGASRPSTATTSHTPAARSKASESPKESDDLLRYDPTVHLDALKEIRERSLPDLERNPFEFPPQRVAEPEVGPAGPAPAPVAPQPPRVALKALGYTEKAGGVREAIITDDEQVFIVHEGETFARKFRVLKISPSVVELDDETTHQSIRLPISP
jgi:hypothetical protein